MADVQILARITDDKVCQVCNYEYDMAKYLESEKSPDLGPCRIFKTMVMCPGCLRKELELERQSRVDAQQRVEELRTHLDVHNSHLASINQLRDTINADETIPQHDKHYALARSLDNRFKHLLSLQKDLNDQLKSALEEQKQLQVYYNELAKKLRADEREKLTIRDVTYKPIIKTGPAPKPKQVVVKPYDKNSVRDAARESGLPEQAIMIVCQSRNVSAVEAVRFIKGAQSNKEN